MIRRSPTKLNSIRDEYLRSLISTKNLLGKIIGVFSQDLGSPFSEGQNYFCEYLDVLLTHARLYIITKSRALDILSL
jgi:hypothetical protein